jgi:hypothetical protein
MNNLNFREFVETPYQYSDLEIANMYFSNPSVKIRDIAKKTSKSITELYQIIHQHGKPNRLNMNRDQVTMLADSGVPVNWIAELTGYSSRHIRNLLKAERHDHT